MTKINSVLYAILAMVNKYGGLKDKFSAELNDSKTVLRVPPVNNPDGFPVK